MSDSLPVYAIIMAGGRGERFWPRSRISRPKQALNIGSENPLLVETIERMFPLVPEENVFINTGGHLEKVFREILKDYNLGWIIEPAQRDTAAAIGFALSYLRHKVNKNFVAIILGADYKINEPAHFRKHLKIAVELASKNNIVTLGIKPTRPATGYGYIHKDMDSIVLEGEIPALKVRAFKEKPDEKTATGYLESGEYLWNSGMFITTCDVMLGEIEKYAPNHQAIFKRIIESNFEPDTLKTEFEKIEKISIDYAVMEKTKHLVVLESSFEWDDLGDWSAMERLIQKDSEGNSVEGLWVGSQTNNSIIINQTSTRKVIATLGVENIVVVDTDDALFVGNKESLSKLKQLVRSIGSNENTKEFV